MKIINRLNEFINNRPLAGALLSAALIGVLALSGQSLWIDELGTWRLTRADGWGAWLEQLLNWRNSDAQIPLYHAWIKLWVSLLGDREWVMRASNLPWLAAAFYAYWRAPVNRAAMPWVRWAGILCALHPLTWYYTNELRPYVVLLAAAAWAGVGLIGIWQESETPRDARLARHFLIAGSALLAAMSAIGAIWTLAFVVSAVALSRSKGRFLGLESGHAWTLVAAMLVVVPVFAQYVHSFMSGVTATALHDHKLVNFAFAFYELLGLGGVGPGRDDLRVAAGAARRAHGPYLAVATAVLTGTFALGLRVLWRRDDRRTSAVVLASSLLPVLVLLGLAELKHWRVVGRHMVPLLFFICVVWAAAVHSLWHRGGWMSRACVGLTVGVLLASALYTIRIVAGTAALSLMPSNWLLGFSTFLFVGLALIKRSSELMVAADTGKVGASGRNYLVDDLAMVNSMGIASSFLSVLVLALYISSPDVSRLYSHSSMLWLLCPLLLYWLTRLWLITRRGGMHDDPVVYAATDGISHAVGLCGLVVVLAGAMPW